MSVKLVVTKITDSEFRSEYEINDNEISIGRDISNAITLPDKNKVVGRKHAKIVKNGNDHQLYDLGTKNFTFVNDSRIKSGEPHFLKPDDVIKCGEFLLTFNVLETSDMTSDATVFIENPFKDEAKAFAKSLSDIYQKYALYDSDWSRSAMQMALLESLSEVSSNQALDVIIECIQGKTSSSTPKKEEKKEALTERYHVDFESNDLNTLVFDSILKMINGYLNFKTEFLGETILRKKRKSAGDIDFYDCTVEELISYLSDKSIDEEETAKRMSYITKLIKEVLRHQVAVLVGYKKCIKSGSQNLLNQISLQSLQKEAEGVAKTVSSVPFLFSFYFFKVYEKRFQELVLDCLEESFVEKKIYRSEFIKAYNDYMDSSE